MALVNLGERLFMNFFRADFVFLVENEQIPGHKAVLAETLPYFEKLLYGGLKESKSNQITITGTSAKLFKEVMRYIYIGQLEINGWTIEDLLALLTLAHEYQFSHLVSEVVKALQNMKLDFNTWTSVNLAASTYNLESLKLMTKSFAEEKLQLFLVQKDLEQFSAEFVCSMFETAELQSVNQDELLRAISKWKTIHGTTKIMAAFQYICWDKVSAQLIISIVKELFSMVTNADNCQFWTQVDTGNLETLDCSPKLETVIEKSLECIVRLDKIVLWKQEKKELDLPRHKCSLLCCLHLSYIQFRFIEDTEIAVKGIEWESPKRYILNSVYGSPLKWRAINMRYSEPIENNNCFKYSAIFSEAIPVHQINIFSNEFELSEVILQNLAIY